MAVREPLERRLADVHLERLFREVELPLIPVLARMEAVGVALDREALGVLEREFAAEISRLEHEMKAAAANLDFERAAALRDSLKALRTRDLGLTSLNTGT